MKETVRQREGGEQSRGGDRVKSYTATQEFGKEGGLSLCVELRAPASSSCQM